MAQDRAATQAIDTIAAIATPPGTAALGLVRLSGPGAVPIAGSLLELPREGLNPRVATLARAASPDGPVDRVLATYFPGPSSPTGEDLVEISAHGSPYILKRLLEELLSAGARLAEPGEFTQRSFLNGRLDLAQAEAVCELISAKSERAHRAALAQLEGGLSKTVGGFRKDMLELLVRLEASLDHPEEDLSAPPADDTREKLVRLREQLLSLAATHRTGRLFAQGARVCIVGRPNAGKSSLLNALLGRSRAIVCPDPGTTRDTIEEAFDLAGLPAVLIDTAGLREEAEGGAERAGLERSRKALEDCDLALLVMDGSRPAEPEDRRVCSAILSKAAELGRPLVTVLNKADLPQRLTFALPALSISALTGTGLDTLKDRISNQLSSQAHADNVVLSIRHHQALKDSAAALAGALSDLTANPGRWEDKVAHRLYEALRRLEEITGVGAPDEVLREIFARFCIGK